MTPDDQGGMTVEKAREIVRVWERAQELPDGLPDAERPRAAELGLASGGIGRYECAKGFVLGHKQGRDSREEEIRALVEAAKNVQWKLESAGCEGAALSRFIHLGMARDLKAALAPFTPAPHKDKEDGEGR